MADLNDVYVRLKLAHVHGMFVTDEERDLIDAQIDGLIASAATKSFAGDAASELEQLGKFQDLIATLYCKYRLTLSKKQYALYREYDRWDLPEIRESAFESIRRGNFPFETL